MSAEVLGAKPVRLQFSLKKGFDLQAHSRAVNGLDAVRVDVTGRWSNPFKIGRWYRWWDDPAWSGVLRFIWTQA